MLSRSFLRGFFSSDAPILPLGDQNSWYYPSHGNNSDEEPLAPGSTSGNWGNKTSAGARWIRRGKIASWGPGMEDWEASLFMISSRPADCQGRQRTVQGNASSDYCQQNVVLPRRLFSPICHVHHHLPSSHPIHFQTPSTSAIHHTLWTSPRIIVSGIIFWMN